MIFTEEHLDEWRRAGYVIVEGFLGDDDLERARADLHRVVPTWEQYRDERDQWPTVKPFMFLHFPYGADGPNDLTFHPELIAFAEQALGTPDLVLSHSEILCKYADDADFDQPMHMDYRNNTFVVPPEGYHEQLASITYYDDVELELGPTRVVSFDDSADHRDKPMWTRDEAPDLFEREHAATVKAGSILLYTMRTFHRGSAFTTTAGARFSHHIAYQRASMTWGGWRSFVMHAERPEVKGLLTRLDPRQRSMVGFPAPGDPYWTEATLEGVQRRYPEMDLEPYRAAMGHGTESGARLTSTSAST